MRNLARKERREGSKKKEHSNKEDLFEENEKIKSNNGKEVEKGILGVLRYFNRRIGVSQRRWRF